MLGKFYFLFTKRAVYDKIYARMKKNESPAEALLQELTEAERAGQKQQEPPKKEEAPKKKGNKWLLTLAFILFNIGAIAVVLLMELKSEADSFAGAADLASVMNRNLVWFFFAFMCYVVHVLCDAVGYFALIKTCGYGNRFLLALRVAILGKYFDNITPWNTGGQPFQIAYLVKANIDGPTACTLPIVKFAIRIFFVDAVILCLFIFVPMDISLFIRLMAYLGIFTSTILPLLLIIFSGKVDFMLKVTKKAVRLMYKLKLVKDYDKQVAKWQDTMDSFLAAFKYLGQHKYLILIIGAMSVLDSLSMNAIPYCIIRSLGGTGNLFRIMTQTQYVTLSSGLIPTPGASGASEGTFYSVFAQTVPTGFLFWAILLWRILVFYIPIFLGVIVQLTDWILGKKGKVKLVRSDVAWRARKTLRAERKTEDGNAKKK